MILSHGAESLCGQATDAVLYLRNGSILNTQVDLKQLKWTELGQANGLVNWSKVKEINLISSSISEQGIRVSNLIADLSSTDYHRRVEAEEQLQSPKIGGLFQTLIAKAAENPVDPESAYRLQRILLELEDLPVPAATATGFDRLTLDDASVRVGDVSNFRISCQVFGKSAIFTRTQLGRIELTSPATKPAVESAPIATQTFNEHGKDFYLESDAVFSFENDDIGGSVPNRTRVDNLFADQGLLMGTEKPGHVEITPYPFKHCPIDSGKRCACPYDAGRQQRLHGVTNLTFCVPGQPTSVAGVKKFGVFIERVNHSRDIVVEAYNALGQMVGMVESTDRLCVFAGFKSNDLITRIRILSNADLPDDIDPDRSYALDCVTFDNPQRVAGLVRDFKGYDRKVTVNFKSGNSLRVDGLKMSLSEISAANPFTNQRSDFSWNDIEAICFPQTGRTSKLSKRNFVQLKNGSIVRVESQSIFSAFDFVGHDFTQEEIVGVWDQRARVPLASDFQSGLPVLSFPSCRILAQGFELNAKLVRWNSDRSEKIVQQVDLGPSDEDIFQDADDAPEPYPDLTPSTDRISFANAKGVPSVWMSQPTTVQLRNGHLLLSDGQIFVLSAEDNPNGFRVAEINQAKKKLVVEFGEFSKAYPLSRVVSFSLPKSN